MSRSTRHSVRPYAEMVAMVLGMAVLGVPAFAAIALLGAALVTDVGVLLVIEYVAMLASMLAAMLLRPAESSHHYARVERQVAA